MPLLPALAGNSHLVYVATSSNEEPAKMPAAGWNHAPNHFDKTGTLNHFSSIMSAV
jgi:hypothetical protein